METSWEYWNAALPFVAVGFSLQLIDSALGLGFGILCAPVLTLLGLHPTSALAVSRTAECLGAGISGISHGILRNIDWILFGRVVIPGIAGAFVGIWMLGNLGTEFMRPLAFIYFTTLGVYLLWRTARRPQIYKQVHLAGFLGLLGGFLDANGGGWGPVMSGSLLAQGSSPRSTIGTVNAIEFFISVTVLAHSINAFDFKSIGIAFWGLLGGAAVAAPLGALLAAHLTPKVLLLAVGFFLLAIGLYGFLQLIFSSYF